jgi:protein-disulfide isomerase-like protein with CxxC motif
LYSKTTRVQNRFPTRVKLVHTTLWLHPLVRAELERIAERESLTLSQVGAAACEKYVRDTIERQQSAILETKMRQIIREENRALGNRIVFFLMKIAFPAEQARILTTNVLKWVCKLAGLDLKAYYKMVDEASSLARRNIIAKSPQIKDLMEKWEGMFTDERQEVKTQGKEERTN